MSDLRQLLLERGWSDELIEAFGLLENGEDLPGSNLGDSSALVMPEDGEFILQTIVVDVGSQDSTK